MVHTARNPRRGASAAAAGVLLETQVRRLVADALGVEARELAAGVSLRDDLAADSLDLLELSLALEAGLGLSVPENALDEARTYGDLVATVSELARRAGAGGAPVPFRAGLVAPDGVVGRFERAGLLTPYEGELLAADARRLGRGARLEVEVAPETPPAALAAIERRFAGLAAHGVNVLVHRVGH